MTLSLTLLPSSFLSIALLHSARFSNPYFSFPPFTMARAAVKRSAWLLISNAHSLHFTSPRLATELPTHTVTNLSSLAANFLLLNRGFCSNLKVPGSEDINLGRKHKSHSELTALLKSFQFSELQIDQIIHRYPKILRCRVSTTLKPKLDYLVECGLSGSALHSLIVSNPVLLHRSLGSFLKPRYEFLKAYLMDKVNMAIKRESLLLTEQSVVTGVKYLEKQGVPVSRIGILLANNPRRLVCSESQLAKMVEATKALGIEPSAPMFVRYIWVFGSMNETSWKKKVEVLESLGWSDEDVRATLLHYPCCLLVSEEKLRRNMDFYINNAKVDPRDVIAQPILLQYSLTGRIIPRYEVLKLLKEYNLLKSRNMAAFFVVPEKRFIGKYIEKNVEKVPHLHQVYCDSKKAKADAAKLCS